MKFINFDQLLLEMLRIDTTKRPAVPPGTFPPGSRIRKSRARPGDTHQVGALGTTVSFPLGPAAHEGQIVYGYVLEWDDMPGLAVFCAGNVLELAPRPS